MTKGKYVMKRPQTLTDKNLTWISRMDRMKERFILSIHVTELLVFEMGI